MSPLGLFVFRAGGGIRGGQVTGVQTCALPISMPGWLNVPVSSFNGLGSGPGGDVAYAYERSSGAGSATLYEFDSATGEWSRSEERRVGKRVHPGGSRIVHHETRQIAT